MVGGLLLARVPLGRGDSGMQDRRIGSDRLHRKGSGQVRHLRDLAAAAGDQCGVADREGVGREKRQAVLAARHQRLDAGSSKRLGAGQPLAAILRPAVADRDLRDRRQLSEVAGTDRPDARDLGMDPGVEHGDQ